MFKYTIRKICSFFYSKKKSFFHFMTPLFVIYGIWLSWIILMFAQYYFKTGITYWQFILFQCFSLLLVVFSLPVLVFTNMDKLSFQSFIWKLFLMFLSLRLVDCSIDFFAIGANFEEKSTQQFILICNFFLFLIVQKTACKYIIHQLFLDHMKEEIT